MMGHPGKPDPYAERQEIPPGLYEPQHQTSDGDPSGFIVGLFVCALPVGVVCFTLGYMTGVFGWAA